MGNKKITLKLTSEGVVVKLLNLSINISDSNIIFANLNK